MKQGFDIYNYPKRLEADVRQIKKADISEKNKQLIFDFRDFSSLEGIGLPRTARYMESLKVWAFVLKKDFDKATKEDITKAVRIIHEKESYSPRTKSAYKIMLKRFYKWLKDSGDAYPQKFLG